jgi:hypothetical protein
LNAVKGIDMGLYFIGIIGMYSIYEVYRKDMGAYFIDIIGICSRYEAEIQMITFPKHVLSYILKTSPGCFVWDAPPLLISPLLYNIALNLFAAAGN